MIAKNLYHFFLCCVLSGSSLFSPNVEANDGPEWPLCVASIGSPSESSGEYKVSSGFLSEIKELNRIDRTDNSVSDGSYERAESRFPIKLYIPYTMETADERLNVKLKEFAKSRQGSIKVIVWGNGAFAAGENGPKSGAYHELIAHWVSHGYVVAAEHHSKKIIIDHETPRYVVNEIRKEFEENMGIEIGKPILAGKSRGGNFAVAYSRKYPEDTDGVVCIGGCGAFGRGAINDAIYVTGERDKVPPPGILASARSKKNIDPFFGVWPANWFVRRSYWRGEGTKQLWERKSVNCRDNNERVKYGTHMSQDIDPLIRFITTDWLRCKTGDQSGNASCEFLKTYACMQKKIDESKKTAESDNRVSAEWRIPKFHPDTLNC